jgi:hypothetical protein
MQSLRRRKQPNRPEVLVRRECAREGANVEFVLAGFRQFEAVRQFYFDAVGADRTRRRVSVDADLDLVRRYRIPVQELPLLCRRLLDARAKAESITFTESDIAQYSRERTAASKALLDRRRAHRPPSSNRVGQAWRGSPPPKGDR